MRTSGEIRSLTGLRFLAALMVLLYHQRNIVDQPSINDAMERLFGRGFLGVAFFFILSGVVLTWSHRGVMSTARFYRRRFFRIVPLYWACLLISLAVKLAINFKPLYQATHGLPALLGLQAWIPNADYYFAINGPSWSISDELFFYLCFPALILLTRSRYGLVLLGLIAVGLTLAAPLILQPESQTTYTVSTWAVYILPLTRLGEFVIGILIGVLLVAGHRPRIPVWPTVLLIVVVYALTARVEFWGQSLLMVVPLGLLILSLSVSELNGNRSWLQSGTMKKLGEWSFAFYLMQFSVMQVSHKVFDYFPATPPAQFLELAVGIAGITVAAAILHTQVELRFKDR